MKNHFSMIILSFLVITFCAACENDVAFTTAFPSSGLTGEENQPLPEEEVVDPPEPEGPTMDVVLAYGGGLEYGSDSEYGYVFNVIADFSEDVESVSVSDVSLSECTVYSVDAYSTQRYQISIECPSWANNPIIVIPGNRVESVNGLFNSRSNELQMYGPNPNGQ